MKNMTLAEIGRVVTGKTPATAKRSFYNGPYMFVTPNELHNGYIVNKSSKTLTLDGLNSVNTNAIDGESVLVGCIGWDMGNVAITTRKCVTNQQINAITAIRPEVNPYYLYYWLSGKKDYLFSIASVTRTPILSKSVFELVTVPIPEREIQDLIASLLTSIDSKIATNNQVNDNLAAMLHTLYEYWFIQFEFPDENGKPYRSSGGKMVWNGHLKREIPAGWELKELGDLLTKNTKAFDYASPLPAIDLSVMPSDSISLGNLNCSDEFSSNLFVMEPGDLLFGGIRPYLHKAGIAPCYGVVAGTVRSFRPKNDSDFNFCSAVLTHPTMFKYAMQVSTGTRMPTVSADALLKYRIPYSHLVVSNFGKINFKEVIIKNVQENIKLQALRDWLLPMLMNGQATISSESTKLSFT